jgi:HK97 family phage portal protein
MFGLKTRQENDRMKALIQEFEVRVGENNELFRALYQFVGAGLPLQRDSHLKEYVKEGYEGNPDLFSIISKLSGMFAGVPLNAMILKGNKYELAINPEVDRLMGRTNYYQTWNEFKRHWIISGYVTGNMITYAPKLTSGINAGKIDNDGLFVMPAQNVEILAGGWRKPIDKYVFDIDETYRIDTSNIWHERFLPTLNYEEGRNFMGMSPLKVAQHLINSQNKGYEMVSKMYNNLHPQSIVYKETDPGQGGETTAEQEAKFRERYKSKYSGINNFTVPIFTLGKVGVARIGYDNLQELQVINMSEHGRRVFCNILGVPAQLFNDTSASTYANVKEAQKAIYTNRIIPDINIFCDGFTILLKPYGDIILKPDFSGIDVLQEDKKEKSEWVSRLYNDGIITGDQYLEMMGQEPTGLPEMNVRYTDINRVPLGFEYTDEIERSNKFYQENKITEKL